MKIKHINAQSLLAHKDELESLAHDIDTDVLCISETWLFPRTPDVHVNISDFTVFRHDKGRGGGVCIYVRNTLTANTIDIAITKPDGIEDIWITVQCRKLPSIIVACVYRHPKAPTQTYDYLLEVFSLMYLRNKSFYILGDLNDDMFSKSNKIGSILRDAKLFQVINKPTRITQTSSTLIDLIITNNLDMIIDSDVLPCEIADHELISITLDIRKPKRQPVTKTFRSLVNYSSDVLCNLIQNEFSNLNRILLTDCVDSQVDLFTNVFKRCLDTCAPVVTQVIRRPPAPWMTDELHNAIRERNNLQLTLKYDRENSDLQIQYKSEKRRVKSLMYKTKTEYYKKQFHNCRGNTAATWKAVRNLVPKNKGKNNVHSCNELNQKVDDFNKFFSSIGKIAYEKSQEGLPGENAVTHSFYNNEVYSFRPTPTDIETVILTVKNLNNTNSCGSDGISLRFVRDALPVICCYLTCITNTSIATGIFPTAWKHALVVPLFKGGDSNDVSQYRPLSLLSILSKILEKIVANQLAHYLESNELLSHTQHGFRSHLSTETALMKVTDSIYSNIDEKKISLLTLCDLSKAFDSVSHNILLSKCAKLKIDPFWFENYLTNRSQSVRIDEITSSKRDLTFGVPQGSILGPILFNIYVNNMSKKFKDCLVVQYADDTQFLHSGHIDDLHDLINRSEYTLKKAKKYFNSNGLMLNLKKTQCIFIGSRWYISRIPSSTYIMFDDNKIVPSNSVKNLGVFFDCYMLFDKHISELSKKVIGTLMFVNRIRDTFDRPTREIVVQSLALSILSYCSQIWGTTNVTQVNRVQKLQNFAAKVSAGARKYDHVTPLLNDLQWLTVKKKIIYDICVTVFKIRNKMLPDWLFSLPSVEHLNQRVTRQINDLYVPRTTTDLGSRSLKIRGPKLWNKIPLIIREAHTIYSFKTKLYKYLLENNI